jgi:type II secretory pathway pseudopilin PulG
MTLLSMKKRIKKLSSLNSQLSTPLGFTLAELVVIIGIALTMLALSTIALSRSQQKASLSATVDTFIADLKEQQAKAMVGDTEGSLSISAYGIDFETTQYTLFRNTYTAGSSSNFVVSLPPTVHATSSSITFAKGSGETTAATVTFTDTSTNEQRTVTLNKYGVITAIN